MGGDKHYRDKVLSLFEPHTEATRKGKTSKPTELGKLVKIQEAENQFVVDYQIYERRPDDRGLTIPSLATHQQLFGRAPYLFAADRGFWSNANKHAAKTAGVKRVCIPAVGNPPPSNARSNINAGFAAASACEPDARVAQRHEAA